VSNLISVLPRHQMYQLSLEHPISSLLARTPPDVVPAQNFVGDAVQMLGKPYQTDAGLVQYVLRNEDGTVYPHLVRLGQDTLVSNPSFRISMEWVALDWDLPSKPMLWSDPNKPEKQDDIKVFISKHPVLNKCAFFYFSKSGVRVIFKIKTPIVIANEADITRWRQMYIDFIKTIDLRPVGGVIEGVGRASPYALSRVPRYAFNGTDTTTFKLFRVNTGVGSEFVLPPLSTGKAKSGEAFEPLDPEVVKTILWNEPLMEMLRTTRAAVDYQDWRAIGTNIAALLGDVEGLKIFHEVSSWDPNYNPTGVDRTWPDIVRSAESYGPVTWGQMSEAMTRAYAAVNPTSSLAAHIRKAAKQGVTNPQQDNRQEVYDLLMKNEKEVKGVVVETVIKNIPNLITILRHDNRWKDKIRRNHLGRIDMIDDLAIEDEHITQMRETIARVYRLDYTKDDMWDTVRLIAMQNEFHPVCNYLSALKWDGVDRVAQLATALGQDASNKFAQVLLRRFMISAVVRPLEWNNYTPSVNWKIDTVLVLKGGQGKRKSTFFKALCQDADWFSDNLPSIQTNPKDASMHMIGKWIVEQAEFDGHVDRASIETLKQFIPREVENFRMPYGRAEVKIRRPSVLVGTTNSESFLNDPTGDRRFWVIEIPKDKDIDVIWVRAFRDQLWAQAVADYQRGELWWLSDAEFQLNNSNNAHYRRPEPILEAVDIYLASEPKMHSLPNSPLYENDLGFSMKALVEDGLDKKMFDIHGGMATKITAFLRSRGWVKERVRLRGANSAERTYCFRKLKDFEPDEN